MYRNIIHRGGEGFVRLLGLKVIFNPMPCQTLEKICRAIGIRQIAEAGAYPADEQ